MEGVPSFVFDFFMERHIALKEEWLSNVLDFLFTFIDLKAGAGALKNPRAIASLVYEQWKYTNLSDTTYPLLKQLGLCEDVYRTVVGQPVVLQVTSIVDIGASFHSQFCALVYEFVDNTGFEPLPEMERGIGLEDLEAKPRRMLCFTVTDGERNLRAIEYHSIKSFSLLTKPGCKIILIPPILCRKGVFCLKPKNVQLLGGDVESLFSSGRPLKVMSNKLDIPIPTSMRQSVDTHEQSSLSNKLRENGVKEERENRAVWPNRRPTHCEMVGLSEGNFKADGDVIDSTFSVHKFTEVFEKLPAGNCRSCLVRTEGFSRNNATSLGFPHMSEFSSRAPSKPVAQVSPMHAAEQNVREIKNRHSPILLEESPHDFDAECGRMQTSMSSSSSYTTSPEGSRKYLLNRRAENTSILSLCCSQLSTSRIKETPRVLLRRPPTLGIRGHLQYSSPFVRKQSTVNEFTADALAKKVKLEVIELDDDEDIKPIGLSSPTVSSSLCSPPATQPLKTVQNPEEDDMVIKFQALNVVHIADAIKQMRFAVGSCRKTIQGIIVDIVDPLRIVDELWTMKVTIQDVSTNDFICAIDNSTLSSLIGLTPKEAMEIRASCDMNRREDGQRRLAAVEEQLKRLDLLLDVELFSGGRADPVIRNIRTFMQALSM